MIAVNLNLDMRQPLDGSVSPDEYYEAAIELAVVADDFPLTTMIFGEHHGADDGYLPSPFLLASAIAGRTRRSRMAIPAFFTMHSAVELAEQAAVLDLISGGRVDLLVMLGYLQSEFAMYGRTMKGRGKRTDEGLAQMRAAFAGEPLTGEPGGLTLMPRPVQSPHPPIYVGGAVRASAARAARYGDGFWPSMRSRELIDLYREKCVEFGRRPGPVIASSGLPCSVFVTNDVEATWEQVGAPCLHAINCYHRWTHEASGVASPFDSAFTDVASLRGTGMVAVVTPDDALRLAEEQEANGNMIYLHPLLGGTHPDVARRSFELFADKVLPHLDVAPAIDAHAFAAGAPNQPVAARETGAGAPIPQ